MQTEKVHLTQEKETMLLALYSRAMESRKRDPLLRDPLAEAAIEQIDYDFERTRPRSLEALQVVLRAAQLDRWTAEFLAEAPDATVLHLGCGQDSRIYRVDPPAGVHWFDLDYPEVIELRQKLYPERPGCCMIGSSVTDSGWLEQLLRERPAWVIAEGLTYYLSESEMKTLFNRLTGHFPGGQIAFDAVNSLGFKLARNNARIQATGASIVWWIDDPNEIQRLDPKLELVTELRPLKDHQYGRLPASFRLVLRGMDLFPSLRRINRLLRYRF